MRVVISATGSLVEGSLLAGAAGDEGDDESAADGVEAGTEFGAEFNVDEVSLFAAEGAALAPGVAAPVAGDPAALLPGALPVLVLALAGEEFGAALLVEAVAPAAGAGGAFEPGAEAAGSFAAGAFFGGAGGGFFFRSDGL